MTDSQPVTRLADDPLFAADIAAVRAARLSDVALERVHAQLRREMSGALVPRPRLVLKPAWAAVMLMAAAAAAATGLSPELRDWLAAPFNESAEPAVVATQPAAPAVESNATAPQPAPTFAAQPTASPPEVMPVAKPAAPVAPAAANKPAPTSRAAPATPPASDNLGLQLELLQRAQNSVRAGAFAQAVREVDALLQNYPTGPLAPEARALRAEALVGAGQWALAKSAVRALLLDPSQSSRRADWWRYLGDIERQGGDCGAAVTAYEQAIAAGATGNAAAAARRGLAECQNH